MVKKSIPKATVIFPEVLPKIADATKEQLETYKEKAKDGCADAIDCGNKELFQKFRNELKQIYRKERGGANTTVDIGSHYIFNSLPCWSLVGITIASSDFQNITLKKTRLVEFGATAGSKDLESLQFSGVSFRGCSFKNCCFKNLVISSCTFSRCKFEMVDFYNCEFHRSTFESCNFVTNVSFERTRLATSTIQGYLAGVSFINSKGFVGDNAVILKDITGANNAFFGNVIDKFPWHFLKYLGSLPLFGVSYVGIFVYIFLANLQGNARELENTSSVNGTLSLLLHGFPSQSMKLGFYSLVSVAIASTLYKIACPAEIKQYSLPQWILAMKEESLRYKSISYTRFWIRLITLVLYVPVLYLAYSLSKRIVTALQVYAV